MLQLTLRMYAKVASWKPFLALALLIAIALLCLFPAKTLAATQPTPAINIYPSSLTFPSYEPNAQGNAATYQIEVVVSNPATTIYNVTLCWLTNANIGVAEVSNSGNTPITTSGNAQQGCLTPLSQLAASGQYVWTLNLTQTGLLDSSSSILFRAAYQLNSASSNGKKQAAPEQYIFQEYKITSGAPQNVKDLANLSVLSSVGTLTDQETDLIYLEIQNKSNFVLTITHLTITHPSYIVLNPHDFSLTPTSASTPDSISQGGPASKTPLKIEPGESITLPIDITVSGAVPSGDQTVVFEVGVNWSDNVQTFTTTLVADQKFTVGVFGTADVLKELALPTMLFLPGFLIVSTLLVLKQGIKSPFDNWIPEFGPKPDFWLAAITLSILADIIYFYITTHKFWAEYDLQDVIIIWISSVIVAVLVYFLILGIDKLINVLQSEWLKGHTPNQNDTPIVSLRKLERKHLDLARNYVRLNIDGEVKRVFLLEPRDKTQAGGQSMCWVAPAICVKWQVGDNVGKKQEEFNSILLQKNAGEMAAFLEACNQSSQPQDRQPTQIASLSNGQAQNSQPANNHSQNGHNQTVAVQNGNAQHTAENVLTATVEWRKLQTTKNQVVINGPYQVQAKTIRFEDDDQQYIVEQDFATTSN